MTYEFTHVRCRMCEIVAVVTKYQEEGWEFVTHAIYRTTAITASVIFRRPAHGADHKD